MLEICPISRIELSFFRFIHYIYESFDTDERKLIEFEILVFIAQSLQVVFEIRSADNYRTTAIVGMEREGIGFLQIFVKEEMNVMFLVVDQAERRNTPRLKAKVFHHAFGRSKRKLARRVLALGHERSLETLLEVMNVKVVIAMETHQIVLVALVIAEEEILAMDGSILFPPAFSLLDGFALGVIVGGKRNLMLVQIVINDFLACHE